MFDLITVGDLQAPAHGLLDAFARENNGDGHWENGVTFTNHGCFVVNGVCLICDDTPDDTFDDQDCAPPAEFKPFELDLGTTWTPADNFDLQKLVESDLDAGSSSKLEYMIWNGCVGGTNPTLADGTSLGSALAASRALGKMMAALIDSTDHIGARGTIYMSPEVAVHVETTDIIETDGKLYTRFGRHRLVVGNFPNTHIAGHLGDPIVFLGETMRCTTL